MADIEKLEKKIKELKMLKAGAVTPVKPIPMVISSSGDIAVDKDGMPIMIKSDDVTGVEVRQDVSDKVRDLVKELSKEGDYRFGVFVGNAGGKRKLIECPHCKEKMVVAGIKAERKKSEKPATEKQKEWMNYVKMVGSLPDNFGTSRKQHMQMASKLKKEGVSYDQLKNITAMIPKGQCN